MSKIKKIYAYEIIDSRGVPTLEGKLELDNGTIVTSSVPSSLNPGKYEAQEIRDHDFNRFDGLGLLKTAVSYINEAICPKLVNVDPLKLMAIDYWLITADGTKNKSKLGTNTTLLISQLVAKAAAKSLNLPLYRFFNQYYKELFNQSPKIERLPAPIFNLINGGKHANNNIEFQEFQIIPSTGLSFSEAYQMGIEIYNKLKSLITIYAGNTAVGDEGSFTPNLSTNIDALEIIFEAINKKELRTGVDIFFGIDVAAKNFYSNYKYNLKEINHPLSSKELLEYLENLLKKYSILYLEDPFAEDDLEGWKKIFENQSQNLYLVGDDHIATNKERLEKAIKNKTCNAITIKPGQVGTLSEVMQTVNLAKKNNITLVVSHRAGETIDTILVDLAVGIQADFVKFGAPCRGERVVKYNYLWELERFGFK